MTIKDFKDMLSKFSDPATPMLVDVSTAVFSVGGKDYILFVKTIDGEVYVTDDEAAEYVPSSRWIINNLAKLDLLAQRIIDMIEEPKPFINPTVSIDRGDEKSFMHNALDAIKNYVDNSGVFQSNILYLVSNAGEGKSTVLSKLAIDQAQRFKKKESNWLLLPIPLGGRPFMRFDDITIGVLQNRYRFQYLYYNSFIELVKRKLIVPAFDGFEEMFVETSSSEAFSAMGSLVNSLDSLGTMIIAARKAYFDFEDFRIKSQIASNLHDVKFEFDKFDIQKWTKEQFLTFANNYGIENPEPLYQKILNALDNDDANPILTRPVFVKKLLDLCMDENVQMDLISKIHNANTNVINTFVESILQRESQEKWVDRSGVKDVGIALLSIDEHFRILSDIALHMWESQKESIDFESLMFVADYFCEVNNKKGNQTNQIKTYLPSHAMLQRGSVSSQESKDQYTFEHESFRMFFLGYSLYQLIMEYQKTSSYLDIRNVFRRRIFPSDVIHSVVKFIASKEIDKKILIVDSLVKLCQKDEKTSYTQENCMNIIIRLLNGEDYKGSILSNLIVPRNSLRSRNLKGITFKNCHFMPTPVRNGKFENCNFNVCSFESLSFYIEDDERPPAWTNCEFINCSFYSVENELQMEIFNPAEINRYLSQRGLIKTIEIQDDEIIGEMDTELVCVKKILRYFMRSSHIGESVLRKKLGSDAQMFISSVLPKLVREDVFEKIQNQGSDNQSRYKLKITLEEISNKLNASKGSYEAFLASFD